MKDTPYYPFNKLHANRYTFTSNGRYSITKVVEFASTGWGKIVNMGFGDLRADGTIDDKINSNNGDLVIVLVTIIEILKSFTAQFPDAEIFFTGSTQIRTRLYSRIVKNYYREFSKEFKISVLIKDKNGITETPYDPASNSPFLGFLIKRFS